MEVFRLSEKVIPKRFTEKEFEAAKASGGFANGMTLFLDRGKRKYGLAIVFYCYDEIDKIRNNEDLSEIERIIQEDLVNERIKQINALV
jgi:hypothetical protein